MATQRQGNPLRGLSLRAWETFIRQNKFSSRAYPSDWSLMKQSLTLEAYAEELADPREALARLGKIFT